MSTLIDSTRTSSGCISQRGGHPDSIRSARTPWPPRLLPSTGRVHKVGNNSSGENPQSRGARASSTTHSLALVVDFVVPLEMPSLLYALACRVQYWRLAGGPSFSLLYIRWHVFITVRPRCPCFLRRNRTAVLCSKICEARPVRGAPLSAVASRHSGLRSRVLRITSIASLFLAIMRGRPRALRSSRLRETHTYGGMMISSPGRSGSTPDTAA